MLHLTLGRLWWPPDAVWRATPREVAAALPPSDGRAPLGRAAFERLMRSHPDHAHPTRE